MSPVSAPTPPTRKLNKARHAPARPRLVADADKRRSKKRQQKWITCICAGFAICVITCVGLLIFADSVISARPAWWAPPDATHARTIATAQRFERRISDRMTMLRDQEERWVLQMSEDEVSSWFASRLPVWLEAEGVGWPMKGRPFDISFKGGSIFVGMPMTGAWQRRKERVVVAELGMNVSEDGGLVVHLKGVTLGRLPLPDAWAKGHLQAAAHRAALDPATVDAVMTGTSALREASLAINPHRIVRVEAITIEDGELALTCVTVPRAHAQR